MELRLYHGRKDPDQAMEENGFWYPVIPGVAHIIVTYLNTWRVEFESEQLKELVQKATGWEHWGDLVLSINVYEDMLQALNSEGEVCYFGDWQIAGDGAFADHPSGYIVVEARPFVGEPQIVGRAAICKVFDSDGTVLRTCSEAHCASEGLGGYDLADLNEARRIVKTRCEAWLEGYNMREVILGKI